MGDLGTFRLASGELVRCRLDHGRVVAYREAGPTLVPCDARIVLNAVKLSDDPEWLLNEDATVFEGAIAAD
ncbi:MAG TPA: hypothetical protein VGA38_00550 [Candidatus Limnocylindria bacterium]